MYRRGKIWWFSYVDDNGKQQYRSTETSDRKLAEMIIAKFNVLRIEGKWFDFEEASRQSYTFIELAEKYLERIKDVKKSFRVTKYIIKQHIDYFGDYYLENFTLDLVEQWQKDEIARGLKNSSINKPLNVLKHMFAKAVDWKMTTSKVAGEVRRVKLLKDDSKRLRYLSVDEAETLINNCDNHLKPIVIMALNTGLRKGNILNLKWSNIDLKNGFILLDDTKNGERLELPMNNTVKDLLRSLPRRLDDGFIFFNPQTSDRLIDIKRSFRSACRRSSIEDFHFHDLRHTFASQLVMAGVSLAVLKDLLGHKSIKMTMRYAHLAPGHKQKAVEIMGNILKQSTDKTMLKTL